MIRLSSALLILHHTARIVLSATALLILRTTWLSSLIAVSCYYSLPTSSYGTGPLVASTLLIAVSTSVRSAASATSVGTVGPAAGGIIRTLGLKTAHAATLVTRSIVTTTGVACIGVLLRAVLLLVALLLASMSGDSLVLLLHPLFGPVWRLSKLRRPMNIGIVSLVPLTTLTPALVGSLLILLESL